MRTSEAVLPGRIPMILALCATLLPVACGFGASGATSQRSNDRGPRSPSGDLGATLAADPGALSLPAPDSGSSESRGRRDLESAERDLAGARRAVADGDAQSAGSHLSLAVRALEEGLALVDSGITPAAATTFEEARRAADRWQAGARPSGSDALLGRVEREAGRLARALVT